MKQKYDHSVHAHLPGREEVTLNWSQDKSGQVTEFQLQAIGDLTLLELVSQWRPRIQGSLKNIKLPQGKNPGAILLREVLLKAKGEWQSPYEAEELCHCRAVPTVVVDQAIVTGAHTPEKVSSLTSASTACGTCRGDVEALIAWRLHK